MFIAMFFAYKFMSKVKDIPKEEEDKTPVEPEDTEETAFGISQNESNNLECEKDA
jgi:hypothetical protein